MLVTQAARPSQIDAIPWSEDEMRMIRDIHTLGLHLVGLDAERVVIAVEGIGGDR